jgi:MoxR-like ATPase
MAAPASAPAELRRALEGVGYFADDELATALFLACELERPLLLEGAPGVGKTAAASALAAVLGAELIRLQCYAGLDESRALYEWNYPRQLLRIRAAAEGTLTDDALYTRELLIERPLLCALTRQGPAVLLVDELDRADEAFEALLLEVLGDAQVTVPELGTIAAARRPVVVLTSNRTRELHDAVRRRCLFHWIEPPDAARELAIVRRQAPEAEERLARAAVATVQRLRALPLARPPGIAETLDWVRALVRLGAREVDADALARSACALVKVAEDVETVLAAEGARATG